MARFSEFRNNDKVSANVHVWLKEGETSPNYCIDLKWGDTNISLHTSSIHDFNDLHFAILRAREVALCELERLCPEPDEE